MYVTKGLSIGSLEFGPILPSSSSTETRKLGRAHEPSSEKAGNTPLKLEFIKLEEGSQGQISLILLTSSMRIRVRAIDASCLGSLDS